MHSAVNTTEQESYMFKKWPKIARYTKPMRGHITEKMDGSNACIIVQDGKVVGCQSRKRIITPDEDNFGFARWVYNNANYLKGLGDGYHYGEWCGPKINGNRHNLDMNTFFLFSWYREEELGRPVDNLEYVRLLHEGDIDPDTVTTAMEDLLFISAHEDYIPEGIVIYYSDYKFHLKHTYENPEGKWKCSA